MRNDAFFRCRRALPVLHVTRCVLLPERARSTKRRLWITRLLVRTRASARKFEYLICRLQNVGNIIWAIHIAIAISIFRKLPLVTFA